MEDTLAKRLKVEPESKEPQPPLQEVKQLSVEQKAILDFIVRGDNVFFTGPGGCGKSFLLQTLIQQTRASPDIYVTATTGIAATHIGGTTLHSFAGIGLGKGTLAELIDNVSKFHKSVRRWKTASMLIVDEASMLSAELFEQLEAIARHFRQNNTFFGGLQIVFVGDFAQLPPVNKTAGNNVRMLFQSQVWQNAGIKEIELKTPFRQKENDMIDALTDLRFGVVSPRARDFLLSVCRPLTFTDGIEPTKLYAKNNSVDTENAHRLAMLPGESKHFQSRSTGTPNDIADLSRNCMAPDNLSLKVGAQVMYLVNANELNLVNGSRGVVTGFRTNIPLVQFTGRTDSIAIMPFTWEKIVSRNVVATRSQLPLKLAWAITIHKSQGMSIDRLIISLKDCFECGQAYVALSRATCKSGLSLTSFDPAAIVANTDVIEYYQKLADTLYVV